MKTAFLSLLLVAFVSQLVARTVTLTVEAAPETLATNSLQIAVGETAEMVSHYFYNSYVSFIKDGKEFYGDPNQRFVVAGPATLRLQIVLPYHVTNRAFATFVITPEAFPPGTGGAYVALECSTNLVDWTTATNGFYAATNSAKFFRIRAERAP